LEKGDALVLGSILIGLDRPDHSADLEELGIRWAQRSGARLFGLGIVDEPGIHALEPLKPVGGTPGVNPVYYIGYENRLAEFRQQAERLLEQFAARCVEAGVAHSEIMAVGSPQEMIEREAQACDLVLLPRHSHFRFTAREDEGDQPVLRKILKHTPRPVVLVPETPCPEGPAVVAYDGSLQAEHTLSAFQATGLAESGRVHIVSVSARAEEASRLAERACEVLSEHQIEAVPHAIESTDSQAKVILEQVRTLGAGMLIMGAYGKPVLREFFLGSVTLTALNECPVPLFLYH
jgi:nucleotide-binding universal stress UspA family protein